MVTQDSQEIIIDTEDDKEDVVFKEVSDNECTNMLYVIMDQAQMKCPIELLRQTCNSNVALSNVPDHCKDIFYSLVRHQSLGNLGVLSDKSDKLLKIYLARVIAIIELKLFAPVYATCFASYSTEVRAHSRLLRK